MKNKFNNNNNNNTTSTGTMSRRSTTISTAQAKSTVNSDAQPSSSSATTNLPTPTTSQTKTTDVFIGTNDSTSSNNASIIVLRSGSNTKILKKQASDVLCRLKKRPLMGNSNSNNYMTDADLNAELTCPICFEFMSIAHITKCGHSFCQTCITRALEHTHKCPKCNTLLAPNKDLFPNFALNNLIERYREEETQTKKIKMSQMSKSRLLEYISSAQDELDIDDVNQIITILSQRKEELSNTNTKVTDMLTHDFLKHLKQIKTDELIKLQYELQVINEDCKLVETNINQADSLMNEAVDAMCITPCASINGSSSTSTTKIVDDQQTSTEINSNIVKTIVGEKRRIVNRYFDELSDYYVKYHNKDFKDYQVQTKFNPKPGNSNTPIAATTTRDTNDKMSPMTTPSNSIINHIRDVISKITDYQHFKTLATINYSNESSQLSSIVSSMDFDRSHDYFACVGVTKKIKIYDFNVIVDFSRQATCGYGGSYHQTVGSTTATTQMDTNYPIFEMQHTSKLSCISWNKYFKNQLACSDYDGAVTLWDSEQGTLLKTYQEHEKRCWGVEFSSVDPRIFASASDDTKVKLWSTNNDYSISSIDAKSNVCCVTFKPDSKFHLIFGTADHSIHYYDLRNTKEPIRLFKAHRKAVSYVKFSNLNQDEFISASTDSSLKLWNLNEGQCLTSFHGHTNEKNFVGLTVNDAGYIATGSENNTVYLYCNELAKPLLTYKFDDSLFTERTRRDEPSTDFVSALCWSNRDILLAANSQGMVKVIELVK